MSIPLNLGTPSFAAARPSDPQALLAGLLSGRAGIGTHTDLSGPPVIAASELLRAGDAGRVVVELDIDPDDLRGTYDAVRFQLDCPAQQLDDAIALQLPSPLAVYVSADADPDTPGLAETAQIVADAGCIPGLPSGRSTSDVADFLAVLAHTSVGFVARAADTAEVLALLSGTVAALRGDDVRTALANPKPEALAALNPDADAAVREVLLGIEVDDPQAIQAALGAVGLR